MALPASGAISLGAVNTELGVSATAARSLNDSTTRALFGVASGVISLSNGYGKANQFAFTISSNQTNANLRTLAVNAGWNQSSKVVATINSGVYISSNSTGTPALTVNGSFPGGVSLVNNGIIAGMGGAGGKGRGTSNTGFGPQWEAGSSGSTGGLALSVSVAVSITNNSSINGGGGGGGGGGASQGFNGKYWYGTTGGGGGGGRSSAAANSAGGLGGTGNYFGATYNGGTGAVGTASSQGAGGARNEVAGASIRGFVGGTGGSGGDWGSAGSTGANASPYNSNGAPYGGGSAGGAVAGNANITWVATGTRNGGIS